MTLDPERDLEITRIIKAPRSAIWAAWTNPASFEQWWIPAPARCKVEAMELRPGGALVTTISEDGAPFGPHLSACYLEIDPGKRIVFTNALVGGYRPAEQPFMTAVITLDEHDLGTAYRAVVMHRNPEDQAMHRDLGFYDGWGTVARQLAELVEA
jgi:uncharacterized protein YndB with AHSA1/START domain